MQTVHTGPARSQETEASDATNADIDELTRTLTPVESFLRDLGELLILLAKQNGMKDAM